jgi:hypothetical protein
MLDFHGLMGLVYPGEMNWLRGHAGLRPAVHHVFIGMNGPFWAGSNVGQLADGEFTLKLVGFVIQR